MSTRRWSYTPNQQPYEVVEALGVPTVSGPVEITVDLGQVVNNSNNAIDRLTANIGIRKILEHMNAGVWPPAVSTGDVGSGGSGAPSFSANFLQPWVPGTIAAYTKTLGTANAATTIAGGTLHNWYDAGKFTFFGGSKSGSSGTSAG